MCYPSNNPHEDEEAVSCPKSACQRESLLWCWYPCSFLLRKSWRSSSVPIILHPSFVSFLWHLRFTLRMKCKAFSVLCTASCDPTLLDLTTFPTSVRLPSALQPLWRRLYGCFALPGKKEPADLLPSPGPLCLLSPAWHFLSLDHSMAGFLLC